jgi:DNA-binding MarR family transcriptional regulator
MTLLQATAVLQEQIRQIMRTRTLRSKFFDPQLFADPVWDMLLALYDAELDQRRTSVSACCRLSNVPPTTALRHVTFLCEKGILLREPDRFDRRRVYLSLSPAASAAMRNLLEEHERLAA